MKKDKIHYSPRRIDSYNKTWNFITSEREAGKTTAIPATKIYKFWNYQHRPSILLRRLAADITATYLDDLQDAINDFLPEKRKIKFEYKKSDIKSGVVNIDVMGRPFCRVIALSCPKSRIKSLRIDNPALMIFDEFIVDNSNGERYLTDEVNKFKEIYNTFNRFATRHGNVIKCYFCGNPYSVYNPYYVWQNVDLNKVKPGAFLVGKNYVVECYKITDELRDFIKKNNPLYEFDDAYTRYAFGGVSVNDLKFDISPRQPEGYKLRYVFRMQTKYLHVFHKATKRDCPGVDYGKYWITARPEYCGSRNVRAVDFENLVKGTQLITSDAKVTMFRLRQAIAERDCTFSDAESGYLTEALYMQIS